MALVVALMMVLVSTLLGVTAMQIGGTEVRTIAAYEMHRGIFHVAEAAALEAYDTIDPGSLPTFTETKVPVTSSDSRIDVVVTMRHEGLIPLANSSLRSFARSAYAIESVAIEPGTGTRRTVMTGATQLMPIAP